MRLISIFFLLIIILQSISAFGEPPSNAVDTLKLYREALSHYKNKKYYKAINALNQLIELYPEKIDNLYYRGVLHYRVNQYEKSIADLTNVIAKKPSANAFKFRGYSYLESGDIASARSDFEMAEKMNFFYYHLGYKVVGKTFQIHFPKKLEPYLHKISALKSYEKKSYQELIQLDRNNDGRINYLDRDETRLPNTIAGSIYQYLDFIITDYFKNYQYRKYQLQDINGNKRIDPHEKAFHYLLVNASLKECYDYLNTALGLYLIDEHQYDVTLLKVYQYFGQYDKREEQIQHLSKKYPNSLFPLLKKKLSPEVLIAKMREFPYQALLLEDTLVSQLYEQEIHDNWDFIEKSQPQLDVIFPYLFTNKKFMTKWISRVQYNIYAKFQFCNTLIEKKGASGQDVIDFKNYGIYYHLLEEIYAKIETVVQNESYHSRLVTLYQSMISNDLELTDSWDKYYNFSSYKDALNYLKEFVLKKNVPKDKYIFVIEAFMKQLISDKKPINSQDQIFGPDELFKKRQGVCIDQSLTIILLIKDLLQLNQAEFYIWIRRAYWDHSSLIFQNSDGQFYIFDSSGISSYSFSTKEKAVNYIASTSLFYQYSTKVERYSNPLSKENLSIYNTIAGKSKSLITNDKKYIIYFSKKVLPELQK